MSAETHRVAQQNDGGAAFPREDYQADAALGQRGMTLRDYFAMHAPRESHPWYEPKMPPRPTPLFDHDHPNERQCTREYECHAVNRNELDTYDDERRKQWELQWPYAWADAMLAERVK